MSTRFTAQVVIVGLLTLVWATASVYSSGESVEATGIEVKSAWARPALPGMNTALYFTLTNASTDAIAIIGIETDVAERAEMHRTTLTRKTDSDGRPTQMMTMEPVTMYEVPAGGSLTLKPGGFHIMLLGVTRDLLEGERIEVTLRTATGDSIAVSAVAAHSVEAGASTMNDHGEAEMHSDH